MENETGSVRPVFPVQTTTLMSPTTTTSAPSPCRIGRIQDCDETGGSLRVNESFDVMLGPTWQMPIKHRPFRCGHLSMSSRSAGQSVVGSKVKRRSGPHHLASPNNNLQVTSIGMCESRGGSHEVRFGKNNSRWIIG